MKNDYRKEGNSMDVKAGDIVKIASEATYYTGQKMPAWVKNDQWIVKSVNGDRAVIDKNTSGKNSINSPVNINNLTVISAAGGSASQGETTVSQQPAQAVQPSAQSIVENISGVMKISAKGVELIAKFEGCRLAAYKCPAGVWTIGYGHTAGVKEGDTLGSNEEAKSLLKQDLEQYAGYVNKCIKNGVIKFSPSQNQFDALTSFTYNCGNGNLQKLVSGRDVSTIGEKILQYNKGGGKVLEGLVKRREAERSLFLS